MLALIDGDIVAYRCAASAEHVGKNIAVARVEQMVTQILDDTHSNAYAIFLSGDTNFRKVTYPEYKQNRVDMVKPKYLNDCLQYLALHWNADITDGYEADDALGIEQTRLNDQAGMWDDKGTKTNAVESIICSIDKDLLQIPGYHYNIVSRNSTVMPPHQALFNFYVQMLMGDRADNIPGYDGTARVKVPKFLEPALEDLQKCETSEEMYRYVWNMYTDKEQCEVNGKLLWIWRTDGDVWTPPNIDEDSISKAEGPSVTAVDEGSDTDPISVTGC